MKPVQLTIGSQQITVDQSPLRTTFIHSHNRFELIRPSAECLVIKNHWGIRLFAWILRAWASASFPNASTPYQNN